MERTVLLKYLSLSLSENLVKYRLEYNFIWSIKIIM